MEKTTLLNKRLELQVIYHVKKASEYFSLLDTDKLLWNALLTSIKEVEIALSNGTLGLFNFHQVAVSMLRHLSTCDYTENIAEERIKHHQTTREQGKRCLGGDHSSTADCFYSLGITQHELGDFNSALESKQRSLDIRCKLFEEQHSIQQTATTHSGSLSIS